MRKIYALATVVCAVTLTACENFGQAMTAHTDWVARAAGVELTVDEAAGLLNQNQQIPLRTEVVDAIANLWVDYAVLALEAARDTTLASIDLAPLVDPQFDQSMVWRLRDKVIEVDTTFTDEELKQRFEKGQTGMEVRARHILLQVPPDATPATRDSATQRLRAVRDSIIAGADFAVMARKHSQDGSAQQGGDLGFFGKGQMVQPFEEAAFSLPPGQLSEIVQTPFGLHLIKVEERRLPDFEQMKGSFLEQVKMQDRMDAEEAYIKSLTDSMNVEIQDGARDIAKELATKPNTELSGRAATRPLVRYKGGSLTAGEYLEIIRRFQPPQRGQIGTATDEQLDQLLKNLTQNELLVQEARKQGLQVTPAEQDSLRTEARRQLRQAVEVSGLKGITSQQGESLAQAVDRKVMAVLETVLKGERNVIPLGPVAFGLRAKHDGQVFERSYQAVIDKAQEARAAAAPPQPQPQPGIPQPQQVPPAPDTPRAR